MDCSSGRISDLRVVGFGGFKGVWGFKGLGFRVWGLGQFRSLGFGVEALGL